MCGIAGLLSNPLQSIDSRSIVLKMMADLEHRGPDNSGLIQENGCTLGHRRLAIIDTSDTGSQPMAADGISLTYNGELYNYLIERKRLQEEGVTFRGRSDTEVLLRLYLHYGETFLEHLRGIYAFALWDSNKQTLICARDPLGIKPFLYANTGNGFLFASELKGMLASGLISREIDRKALQVLLLRGSVTQPDTILEDVKSLMPGQLLKVKPGKVPVISTFKKMKTGCYDMTGATWPEMVNQGREILHSVLEQQLISDVPVGAFLSGGLDSSLLVALMAQNHAGVKTFSVGFEAGLNTQSEDETNDAALLIKHLNVDHTEIVITPKEVKDIFPTVVRDLDHPSVDGVNSWFISRIASKEVKVAISGTGGDELFAGYPWFKAMQDFVRVPWYKSVQRKLVGNGFAAFFADQYFIFDHQSIERLCFGQRIEWHHPDPLPASDPLSRVTGMLLNGYTRDQLLLDIDTASMAHGLEVRVPYLDESLLEFALSLPESAKIGGNDFNAKAGSYAQSGCKRILMEIAKPLLCEGFMLRQKRGFSLPFDGWLRGIAEPLMLDVLSPETLRKRQWFNPDYTQEVIKGFKMNQLHWTRPWLLMAIELWAQEFIDNR
jgi:asparagine synthase (glutamine-hydrolysing)